MTTVAVTGGTGFIGTTLIHGLVDAGYQVRALTRRAQPERSGVIWVHGEFADEEALAALVSGAQALVHCAGAVRGASRRDFDAVNVDGTARLGRICAGRTRFLHLSSLAARQPSLSFYSGSKADGESALAGIEGLDYTVFRPPAVYGPGDKELKPLLDLMFRGIGFFPEHPGRFALIYIDDLINAILSWLVAPAASVSGRCFELNDGAAGYDWAQIAAAVEEVGGVRVRKLGIPKTLLAVPAWCNQVLGRLGLSTPMLTPGKLRELYFEDWTVDAEPVCSALAWRPQIDLATGLGLTFALTAGEVVT